LRARPHVGTHRQRGVLVFRTRGATDPLTAAGAIGASFLPLGDGQGDSHISCLHLDSHSEILASSITHAAALLVVHGRATIKPDHGPRINFSGGMGAVFDPNEPYSMSSERGAILLIVESLKLTAHERGISTPGRIAGQRWPVDPIS
jgi:hypothetical protein